LGIVISSVEMLAMLSLPAAVGKPELGPASYSADAIAAAAGLLHVPAAPVQPGVSAQDSGPRAEESRRECVDVSHIATPWALSSPGTQPWTEAEMPGVPECD